MYPDFANPHICQSRFYEMFAESNKPCKRNKIGHGMEKHKWHDNINGMAHHGSLQYDTTWY